MSIRSFSVTLSLAASLILPGCQGAPEAPNPAAQTVVESTAKANPDVLRLTVHMVPPGGGECCAIASTSDVKRGKPSDPEDIKAMQTGEVVVLDEPEALDVTVPIMQNVAAVGVTLRTSAGADRDALIARAKEIAAAVEKAMAIE